MFSYHKPSEYHDKCVPAAVRAAAEAVKTTDGGKPLTQVALSDPVSQDKIWKSAVKNEQTGAQQWKEHWGFLTEYDPQGRPKTPKVLPDKISMYSTGPVPDTNAGLYGSRLSTDVGQRVQEMEFAFNSDRRKRKMGSEMVCY